MNHDSWTAAQVLALSEDDGIKEQAQRLAQPNEWMRLFQNEDVFWGYHRVNPELRYLTILYLNSDDLNAASYTCSCPAQPVPCVHILGLLLLVISHQEAFLSVQQKAPAIEAWLYTPPPSAPAKSTTASKKEKKNTRLEKRHLKMRAGIDELELLLTNIIRGGLSAPELRSYNFWKEHAKRMVDAQIPGIGRAFYQIAYSVGADDDWAEKMLLALGRLYLIVKAYQQFDSLSEEAQYDLRDALGWSVNKKEILEKGGIPVKSTWVSLGSVISENDNLYTCRQWLYDKENHQFSMVLEHRYGQPFFSFDAAPGTEFETSLVYYPSCYPLRAFALDDYEDIHEHTGDFDHQIFKAYANFSDALSAYSQALALNPWISQFPMFLSNIFLRHDPKKDAWRFEDKDGRTLPFPRYWHHYEFCAALSGGEGLMFFGEWNDDYFLPYVIFYDSDLFDVTRGL